MIPQDRDVEGPLRGQKGDETSRGTTLGQDDGVVNQMPNEENREKWISNGYLGSNLVVT